MKFIKSIKQNVYFWFLWNIWKKRFQDSISLINRLEAFRNELIEIDIDLVDSKSVLKNQKAWIWLFVKFERKDRKFFKPYWIWLDKNANDHFIDISMPNSPIFTYKFYSIEPYHWQLIPEFESIEDLISKLRDGKYREDYKREKNMTFEERLENIDLFS